ncbi:MAG: ArgR family transcriptional regulator [Colwellia sp.]|nr:ArgR family transcriptional regulator [Colwellia sp.]
MMNISESDLLDTVKSLLNDQRFGSQLQLARALSLRGFENVTQTRISRLLKKVGAIKFRNNNNDAVYRLPAKQYIPRVQESIDSVILGIKHNNMQIIIKTVIGAARLIAKIVEDMGESSGILACMASDNTILVIPSDVSNIEETTNYLINYLDMKAHTSFASYS